MNECFFCGPTESPLTKEHVWPRWVSRLLRGRYNSDHFRQLRAVGDNTTANRSSPQDLNVTTETVCSGCNNEWLSIFENDQIKPLASPLIIGRDAAALTPESQSLLAAWAYKMAMLMDIAHPDKTGEFFTPAERLLFRQTTSAHPLLRVFLGRYNFGWRPAHAHTPRPTVTGETGARRTFHLKISTITAGHLATQVVAVRSAESNELVPASEIFEICVAARAAVIPIWPTVPESVSWPPAHTMNHQDIEDWTRMWSQAPSRDVCKT